MTVESNMELQMAQRELSTLMETNMIIHQQRIIELQQAINEWLMKH